MKSYIVPSIICPHILAGIVLIGAMIYRESKRSNYIPARPLPSKMKLLMKIGKGQVPIYIPDPKR